MAQRISACSAIIAGVAKKKTHGGVRCADVTGSPVIRLVAASAAIFGDVQTAEPLSD